jgi:hypothetical protein
MSDSEALTPDEVRTVEFYGDTIIGALVHINGEAHIYVPLRPFCDFLGLSWSGQRQRTMRDEVLSTIVRGVCVTHTPGKGGGGTQELLCIPIEFLPGWLFGVSTQRIKAELRERLILYRRECYARLWDAFKYDVLQSLNALPAVPPDGAALAYELATALQNLARDQMELEQRMGNAAQWAKGIDARVTALELKLQPDQQITEAQATELATNVKAVANALEQQGATNGYQRVYGELYRRYSIGTYRALPQQKFTAALEWLRRWYEELPTSPTQE